MIFTLYWWSRRKLLLQLSTHHHHLIIFVFTYHHATCCLVYSLLWSLFGSSSSLAYRINICIFRVPHSISPYFAIYSQTRLSFYFSFSLFRYALEGVVGDYDNVPVGSTRRGRGTREMRNKNNNVNIARPRKIVRNYLHFLLFITAVD